MKVDKWSKTVSEIRATLIEHYPTLHIKNTQAPPMIIWGVFPVQLEGKILERYEIEVVVDSNYPESVPSVWEVGDKIPRDVDHHVFEKEGNLCLFYPDAREWYWSRDDSFLDFLKTPVNDHFLSQIYFRQYGKWPFGEMRHGVYGCFDFYAEKLGTANINVIISALECLESGKAPKGHWACYCGSGKRMRNCHIDVLRTLHKKIKLGQISFSLNWLRRNRLFL